MEKIVKLGKATSLTLGSFGTKIEFVTGQARPRWL